MRSSHVLCMNGVPASSADESPLPVAAAIACCDVAESLCCGFSALHVKRPSKSDVLCSSPLAPDSRLCDFAGLVGTKVSTLVVEFPSEDV